MGSAPSKAADTAPAVSEKEAYIVQLLCDDEREFVQRLTVLDLAAAPFSEHGALTPSVLKHWEEEAAKDLRLGLARTILSHTDIASALLSRAALIADSHVFNVSLPANPAPVTNQRSSGRCWLFATTNIIRYSVISKLNLKEFELSQSYLFFWDKLEKANYFLESSIQNAHLPIDDRLVSYLSKDPISDGGQWDMVCNLLERYGVVPQAIFPESFSSSASSRLNKIVTLKLREHSLILRELAASASSSSSSSVAKALRAKKEECLSEIYRIMSIALGVPPSADKTFTWEYYDANDKVRRWEGTPIEFYKSFSSEKYPPLEAFSLINDPRNPYDALYSVASLGNVWGARPVRYVNTSTDRLKDTVLKCIKAGHPVFFGCDVGQFSHTQSGVMDTNIFDYENAFGVTFGLTKAQRLQVNESAMTHAMVITAVHIDQATKKIVRFKVENSWGEDAGKKGYFVMTDKWFDEFVYQVVVPRSLADKDFVEILDHGEATVFPPWDPMGTLA
ncbi:hypothetical protein BOTBODRAFT_158482 [Botryobasidium botryosum FD-172 SS1]|uniref:Cysteine proteinase 1, mitochondrial n=1 Tax=Botryobasidium botryosum (strain FD-172 SS1) TaxID=930990 RepID=A0A067MHI3_BOTB1|nr:hypothetical protein BOTBODRAFT_158482 [Botryobasidium botryosum FD-172 SS1]